MNNRINRILLGAGIIAALAIFLSLAASAHSWYPMECCHEMDCAMVDKAEYTKPTDGTLPQLIVTSKHGTVIVPHNFPTRQSLSKTDNNMHVCMRPGQNEQMRLICLFVPGGS